MEARASPLSNLVCAVGTRTNNKRTSRLACPPRTVAVPAVACVRHDVSVARHVSAWRTQVYAQRQGGAASAYRFTFDGNRIVDTQTPDDVRAQPLER